MRRGNRGLGYRSIAAVLAASVFLVACGGSEKPKSTERLLTLDEATLLASVQFDNYEDRGAAFQVATAFLASNDTLTLQGVVDWERHVGYAVAVAKGAEDGITELYWTDDVVLERRPAADPILTGMGYEGVRYFARQPEPEKRLLDRALAIVFGLASTQRENPQLILQKAGSAFLRTDTLRGTDATVLRFGERNLYWLDSASNRMLRFEGNAAGGGAPTVVDVMARGAQNITLPAESTAIAVESMQELYDALRAGGDSDRFTGNEGWVMSVLRLSRLRVAAVAALVGVAAMVGVGCGSDQSGGEPSIIRVPSSVRTISEAVNKAKPGDIVLLAPGTYHESVKIYRPGITVRGEDRNAVILDGQHKLANGFLVGANNVAIENLTVHSFTQNGVVFSGIEAISKGKAVDPNLAYGTGDAVLSGYRVSYVTAYNNGLYGIYAFSSRDGVIEHTYVSGHPDSGLYIGQCKPCNVVLRNNTAEYNAIGYYGTNASGGVYVINSVYRHNRLGIAPNSQKAENLAPQEETVVAGNLVANNSDAAAPEISMGFAGGGIAIGGGTRNMVVRNRVEDNGLVGIIVINLNEFLPLNNTVEGNVLSGNQVDLGYGPTGTNTAGGNCFANNTFVTSVPADIEQVMACGTASTLTSFAPFDSPPAPDGPDYRSIPAPPAQPTMPTEVQGATGGAGALQLTVDVGTITVPNA